MFKKEDFRASAALTNSNLGLFKTSLSPLRMKFKTCVTTEMHRTNVASYGLAREVGRWGDEDERRPDNCR